MFHLIKKHDSLAKRIVLLAFTTISLSVVLTGTMIVWNFNKSQERTLNTHLTAYIDTLIAVTYIDNKGEVSIKENISMLQHMPFYWQISANGRFLRKSPLMADWINTNTFKSGQIIHMPLGQNKTPVTLVSKNFTFPGNKKVNYLFGIQSPIANALLIEERQKFTAPLFILLTLLAFFLIIMIAFIQVKASTTALKKIKSDIADIHEGRKKILSDGYPKEIWMLAQEINKLINYNLSVTQRYSTFAANLSHALKTPLTVIHNESQKSSSKLAKTIQTKTNDMIQLIDRNLSRVKMASASKTLSTNIQIIKVIKKISNSFGKLYSKTTHIEDQTNNAIFQGNEPDIFEMLGNIIENGCKYSKSQVKITLKNKTNALVIIVEDDGPGIPQNALKDVLKHGTRLDKTKPGSGIGLAVTSDIASLYGGSLSFSKSNLGGLKAIISLPV